jgi:serine/threonine-protein phosphatase 2B catalytic subunit
MLVAVLNTCTKEELEDDDDVAMISSPTSPVSPTSEESVERRKVIKNKIMAVGRMARVFALLRCAHLLRPSFQKLTTLQGGI